MYFTYIDFHVYITPLYNYFQQDKLVITNYYSPYGKLAFYYGFHKTE